MLQLETFMNCVPLHVPLRTDFKIMSFFGVQIIVHPTENKWIFYSSDGTLDLYKDQILTVDVCYLNRNLILSAGEIKY